MRAVTFGLGFVERTVSPSSDRCRFYVERSVSYPAPVGEFEFCAVRAGHANRDEGYAEGRDLAEG